LLTLAAWMTRRSAFSSHERELSTDAVEKLGFPRCSLSPQKNDLHNRSVLDDPVPGNIKPIPKNRPKIRYLSFSTESTLCSHSSHEWFNGGFKVERPSGAAGHGQVIRGLDPLVVDVEEPRLAVVPEGTRG
ncbi:MAG: hypothetical protein WCF02_01365, partial [Azonexus sp.]